MAEIRITKKKPVWPWVLLILLLLAALAYFYYESTQAEQYNARQETGSVTVPVDTTAASPVGESLTEAYLTLLQDRRRLARDSTYTRMALHSLGRAVRLTAEKGGIQDGLPLRVMESRLNLAEKDDSANRLPYHIQKVGEAMIVVFQSLYPESKYPPEAQVLAASKSVAAINPDEAMYTQKNEILDFFDSSGALLLELN